MPYASEGAQEPCQSCPLEYADVFRFAPVGLTILDEELRYVCCNEELAAINGVAVEDHIGRTVREVVPDIAKSVEDKFLSVFATGEAISFDIAGTTPMAPDEQRTWRERAVLLPTRMGAPKFVLVCVEETTALTHTQKVQARTQLLLDASHQYSPDGFMILRAIRNADGIVEDFEWEYANQVAETMMKEGPLKGRRLLEVAPDNRHNPRLFERYARILNENRHDEVELEYRGGDVAGWFQNNAVAVGNDFLAVSFRNITTRKSAESRLELLNQEFRHRVKNVIAVTGALVASTAHMAKDVQSFSSSILQRLQALSAAQDILTGEPGAPVSLASVASAALAAFAAPNLRIDCEQEIDVPGTAATSLALALNELGTNAMKYGALSTREGKVTLSCTRTGDRARIIWEEMDGPDVVAPEETGFGTKLIKAAIIMLPDGHLHVDYRDKGLKVEIAFALQ